MAGEEDKEDKTEPKWYQGGVRFTGEYCSGKEDETEPKWYQVRIRFTGEYCSGIVSGLGLGIAVLAYPMHYEYVRDFSALISVAALMIWHIGVEFGRQSQRDLREGHIMNTETDGMKRKGYYLRHPELTGEYFAGVIAGFALGIVVLICVSRDCLMGFGWMLAMICGFVLIAIGSSMHRHIRQQRAEDSSIKD